MFFFISTFFEALQAPANFIGDSVLFSTTATIGSWLDYVLICFVTPINLIFKFICFITPINLIVKFTCFVTTIGSWLDHVLIFVAPVLLIWVHLTGRGIGKIVRDTSVTLGSLAAVYQARLLAQNGDNDRLRREAEARAREAEARRAEEAKAAEAKARALQNQVRSLEAEIAKAKSLAKK